MARLVVVGGPADYRGECFQLGRGAFAIGRAHGGRIQIVDPEISRSHCSIWFDKGQQTYWVRDGGSENGTLVNGVAIQSSTSLKGGEILSVGNTELKFELKDCPANKERLRRTDQREIDTLKTKDRSSGHNPLPPAKQ